VCVRWWKTLTLTRPLGWCQSRWTSIPLLVVCASSVLWVIVAVSIVLSYTWSSHAWGRGGLGRRAESQLGRRDEIRLVQRRRFIRSHEAAGENEE
jgi:hypothetical protein